MGWEEEREEKGEREREVEKEEEERRRRRHTRISQIFHEVRRRLLGHVCVRDPAGVKGDAGDVFVVRVGELRYPKVSKYSQLCLYTTKSEGCCQT